MAILFRFIISMLILGSGFAIANPADEPTPTPEPVPLACVDLLKAGQSLVVLEQAVIDLFMVKARMGAAGVLGIEDRNSLKIVEAFASVTGHLPAAVAQNLLDLGQIFEKEGANEDMQMLIGLLALSELYSVPAATVFQSVVDLQKMDPKGKAIKDASSAIQAIKLSIVYALPLETVVGHLADLRTKLGDLDNKVEELKKAAAETADPLALALINMLAAVSGRSGRSGVEGEIVMALLESILTAPDRITAEVAIKGYGEILSHERASKYTIHEQAAMLKALLVQHQTLEDSLKLLVALESGSNQELGGSLPEMFERAAVNLIFFAGQTPNDVLGFMKAIGLKHSHLDQEDAGFIMNRTFNILGTSALARSAQLFGI